MAGEHLHDSERGLDSLGQGQAQLEIQSGGSIGGRERGRGMQLIMKQGCLVLVPFLSALFPSNVGGKNLWRECWV